METFREKLCELINRQSRENGSNTPDMILAEYLTDCLVSFDKAVKARDGWFGDKKMVFEAGLNEHPG